MSYAHLELRQLFWSDPENMEWRHRSISTEWSEWVGGAQQAPPFREISLYEVRRKPRKLYIPRAEVPAPLTEAPEIGTECWVPRIDPLFPEMLTYDICWLGTPNQLAWLERGFIYATEDAARNASLAMLAREYSK
jgi:hypothetical protein